MSTRESAQQRITRQGRELKAYKIYYTVATRIGSALARLSKWKSRRISHLTSEVARLEAQLAGMREALETLRRDASLWRVGRAGGCDKYAGLPPAMRIIDIVLYDGAGTRVLKRLAAAERVVAVAEKERCRLHVCLCSFCKAFVEYEKAKTDVAGTRPPEDAL